MSSRGTSFKHDLADALRTILGVRGRWLAAKNPKWRKYAGVHESAEPASVWETGTLHERLAALVSLRGTDPGRARELVASTFAADSADQRAKFVGEFARGLSMEDEPFLEAALDDRSKEVRRQAAELLRSLPESRLCLRMIERARACAAAGKAARSSSSRRPPATRRLIRDGVEPKPAANIAAGRAGLVAARGRVGRADEGDRRDPRRDRRADRRGQPRRGVGGGAVDGLDDLGAPPARRGVGRAAPGGQARQALSPLVPQAGAGPPGGPSARSPGCVPRAPPPRRVRPLAIVAPGLRVRRVRDEPGRHRRPPARSSAAFDRSSRRSTSEFADPARRAALGSGRAGSTTRSIMTIRSSP